MVQHWTYVHELNGALTELVKILTTEYRAWKRLLNPIASPYIYEKEIEKGHKMDETANSTAKPSRRKQTCHWTKVPTRYGPYQVQERMKSEPSNRENKNRFKELEDNDDDNDGEYKDKDEIWASSEDESQSCDSKAAKAFDVEQMSTEDLDEVLRNTMDECHQCEEKTDAYEGLLCECNRIAQYAIEQESQTEDLSNTNHYILLLNYLEVNERKALRNNFNKIIDEHSIFRDEALENGQVIIKAYEEEVDKNKQIVKMYDNFVDEYNDLLE